MPVFACPLLKPVTDGDHAPLRNLLIPFERVILAAPPFNPAAPRFTLAAPPAK